MDVNTLQFSDPVTLQTVQSIGVPSEVQSTTVSVPYTTSLTVSSPTDTSHSLTSSQNKPSIQAPALDKPDSTTQPTSQEKIDVDISTIIKSMLSNENASDASKSKMGTLPSSSGLIKCPIYCRHNCVVQHHPLLVAILNCVDTEEMELMDMKLSILKSVINKYTQSSLKWKCDDVIPDVFTEYRYPILHWACMLGRIGAAVWLVGYQYCDATTRAVTQNSETALHKALLFLQETCPKHSLKKFVQLLSVMEPALAIPDKYGNTPVHLCCEMLRTEMPRPEFYKDCLQQMLTEMNNCRDEDYLKIVLNMTNHEGETPLHLLTKTDKCPSQIKLLVKHGASPLIKNKEGLTPIDLTEKNKYISAYNYLLSVLNKEGINYTGRVFVTTTSTEHKVSDADKKANSDSLTNIYASPMKLLKTRSSPQGGDQGLPAKRPRTAGSSDGMVPDLQGLLGDPEGQGNMKLLAGSEEDKDADVDSPSLLSPISLTDHQFCPLVLYDNPSPEQEAIQEFFQDILHEQQQRRLNNYKTVKKEEPPHPDMVSLTVSLFKTAIGSKDNILIQGCVDKLLSLTAEEQTQVVEHLMENHNTTTKHLQYTTKAIDRIRQLFRDTKQQQESLVSSIMAIVDSLGNLQKEEQEIDKEISKLTEQEEAAEVNNAQIKERLKNCQNAIEVLKQLHQQSRKERKKVS